MYRHCTPLLTDNRHRSIKTSVKIIRWHARIRLARDSLGEEGVVPIVRRQSFTELVQRPANLLCPQVRLLGLRLHPLPDPCWPAALPSSYRVPHVSKDHQPRV